MCVPVCRSTGKAKCVLLDSCFENESGGYARVPPYRHTRIDCAGSPAEHLCNFRANSLFLRRVSQYAGMPPLHYAGMPV